jgi:hypothetical protein
VGSSDRVHCRTSVSFADGGRQVIFVTAWECWNYERVGVLSDVVSGGGYRSESMVDLVGIEPTTSSMPWKRAPKLRHRPTCKRDSIIVSAGVEFVNCGWEQLRSRCPSPQGPANFPLKANDKRKYPGDKCNKKTCFSRIIRLVKSLDSVQPIPLGKRKRIYIGGGGRPLGYCPDRANG